jgi:hypothetical protein
MCTLTVVRLTAPARRDEVGAPLVEDMLWRVKVNRDERRDRPAALPPVERVYGRVRATHPIDVPSGGTWIAATSAGLVLALLNEPCAAADVERPTTSRGLIIPHLLDATDLDEIAKRACRLDARCYAPFRLVAIDGRRIHQLVGDGHRITHSETPVTRRWMSTSSSVRPAEIAVRRAEAFERLVTEPSIAAQDRFHEYFDRARSEEGVRMARPDARTVSTTAVEVFRRGVTMAYRPLESTRLVPLTS